MTEKKGAGAVGFLDIVPVTRTNEIAFEILAQHGLARGTPLHAMLCRQHTFVGKRTPN